MVDTTISDLVEKTVLLDADLVEIVDSATVGSKKAQIGNIGNRIFTGRDTDDLIEGTINKYVTSPTPKLGGDLDYNSNGVKVIGQTVGGSNGESVYLSGSNTWSQADSSVEATCKTALGIRISATEVLVHGVYTTSGLTAGSLYYVSETAGGITATIPTTSLSIVRPIAYALTTTELYVFPSGSYVENA